jgi:hypothetical protein
MVSGGGPEKRGQIPHVCRGVERITIVETSKNSEMREELLKSKWPYMNEEIAMRKVLSKMPHNRETWVPSHTVLNANGKTRLRMKNGNSETVCRTERL